MSNHRFDCGKVGQSIYDSFPRQLWSCIIKNRRQKREGGILHKATANKMNLWQKMIII